MACLHVNSTTSTKNVQEHDIHFASAKAQLLNHCRRSTWFRHVAKLQWSFGVSLPPKVVLIGQVGNDQNLNIIERKMEDRLVLDLEDSENSIFNMCVCVLSMFVSSDHWSIETNVFLHSVQDIFSQLDGQERRAHQAPNQ